MKISSFGLTVNTEIEGLFIEKLSAGGAEKPIYHLFAKDGREYCITEEQLQSLVKLLQSFSAIVRTTYAGANMETSGYKDLNAALLAGTLSVGQNGVAAVDVPNNGIVGPANDMVACSKYANCSLCSGCMGIPGEVALLAKCGRTIPAIKAYREFHSARSADGRAPDLAVAKNLIKSWQAAWHQIHGERTLHIADCA